MLLALASLGPQPRRGFSQGSMPFLDLAPLQLLDLDLAQRGPDVGLDRNFEPLGGFTAAAPVVGDVVLERLADGVGAVAAFGPISPRKLGEPDSGFRLGLGEGQNVLAVCVGHIIGRAKGLVPPSVVAGVVARNDSEPVRFSSLRKLLLLSCCSPGRA